MADQSAPPPDRAPLAPIAQQLARLRARAVWLLVLAGAATLLSVLAAAALGLGVLDYILRTPTWFRGILWLAGMVTLTWAGRRWLLPAWRFRPSLTDVALRLERSEEGKRAGLAGVLASGLELSEETPATPAMGAMARHVVEEARARFRGVKASTLLSPRHTRHSLTTLVVCLAGCLAVALLAGPRLAGIGAARVLAPWSGAQWPKRTALADATSETVHPLGTALALRAAVTRAPHTSGTPRVIAKYRVVSGSTTGLSHRALLNDQGRTITLGDADTASGQLFERLIEPGAMAVSASGQDAPAELEYWFESEDDRTEPQRIKLVPPPAVLSAQATVTPPPYATAGAEGKTQFIAGAHELGSGNDQRAVVGPVLGGSRIDLKIRLNKSVPPPPAANGEEGARALDAWLASAFPGAAFGDDLRSSFDGAAWSLSWAAKQSMRLPVHPTDEYGLKPNPGEESAYSFDVAEDRAPTATVIEPREDETVLATAVVDVSGEARDDVGIGSLGLTRQLARPAKGSMGAAPEPTGQTETVATLDQPGTGAPAQTQASVAATIDLATLGLKPGEELWLRAVASDTYNLDGITHPPVQSSPRKLRIIREEDLVEQVRAELAAVRKIAIKMEEEQADLRKATQSGAVSPEDRRRQAGLTQRLTQQNESIKRLSARVQRNKLSDEAISGLLNDISANLQSAAQESEQASSQMDAAAKDTPEQEKAPLTPEKAESISKNQQNVRDELTRLAEMLDRGEDSWLASRSVQRLLEQQRELQARTQRTGEKTMGKKAQDLTPQERSELSQIAEQQQRLADAARQAIDRLGERAKQLEKSDAAQSQGMKEAARRGREQQVPEKMNEAAKQAEQNQTSQAAEQQQQAADALEQMLQDMNSAQKNRDATLRQILANVIQSLEKLIQEQDGQINALAAAIPASKFDGLDAAMITLNQNTLAVADQARGDRSMAKIAELVDRAGKSQESSIADLRASPVKSTEADQAEHESLRLLNLAHAEAKKLEEEARKRDTDRKRQELRKVYREALEQQVALRGETDPFVGKSVERRDRMKVRGLGERQETLRVSLEELHKKTQELTDATVFDYAHKRLDQATTSAGKKLRAGQADKSVARNQDSAVRILTSLVQALDDQAKKDDEFREDDNAGSGGGGGSGQKPPLIPPLTELRLLRAMQQEAADVTRAIDDARDTTGADELAGLGELQRGLSDRGQDLIKKLQQNQPGQKPDTPGKD